MLGPLDALRRLAAGSASLLLTRAELATMELARERRQLVRWLIMTAVCFSLVMLALLGLSATLTIALWDRLGWITPAAFTVLYGAIAAFVYLKAQSEITAAPPLFSTTLAELAKDRDALFGTADEVREARAAATQEEALQAAHRAAVSAERQALAEALHDAERNAAATTKQAMRGER
jgi:uncharacterized membrane protein YqjE